MNWLAPLYGILVIVVALDAAASTLAAWYIFRLRQRFGTYIAMACVGTAAEAWTAIITLGFTSQSPRVTAWVIGVRILARAFKALTMVYLALYLLGFRNGKR